MKRDDLTKLLLAEGQTEPTDDQKAVIDQIMTINGQDVEKAKGDRAKLEADLEAAQADAVAKQQQIEAANAKIKEFESKDLDLEAVRQSAAAWETQAKKNQDEAAARLLQVKFDHALERDLAVAKAKNPVAARALLNLDSLKYDEKGDKVIGLEEQVKAIRADNEFLFESDEPPAPPPPSATAGGTPSPRPNLTFLERTLKAAGVEPAEKEK